jgi:hypothetical protein
LHFVLPAEAGAMSENWLPTAENINALPEPIRAYIHDLEMRGDPAGDVRARILAEDTVRALLAKLAEHGIVEPRPKPNPVGKPFFTSI